VFGVCQGLVDPSLDYAGIQDVASVLHAHNLLNSVLERISVGIFVLSDTANPIMHQAIDSSGARLIQNSLTTVDIGL
jgi:hypothetical protein